MSKLFASVYLAAYGMGERIRREDGQSVIEYALVVGLIAIATVTALTALKTGIVGKLTSITTSLG